MIALTNANIARKAIKLAAIFATSMIDAEAPAAAASKILRSFLKKNKNKKINKMRLS